MKVNLTEIVDADLIQNMPDEHVINLLTTFHKINCLRQVSPFPFIIRNESRSRSGYRTLDEHLKLYAEINARRATSGLNKIEPPLGSMHLIGAAVDILDADGRIQRWICDNLNYAEQFGLWFEEFEYTPSWVHAQIYPPASGKRFFKP